MNRTRISTVIATSQSRPYFRTRPKPTLVVEHPAEYVSIGLNTVRLYQSTTYISLLPVLEQYLPLWIWKLICLKQNGLRPPFAFLQLEFILVKEMCKYEFDLMTSNPPSRASVSAHSKLHLFLGDACYLELVLVLQ